MDRFQAIENHVAGVTENVSSVYVPPLQLTKGQPPPIAAQLPSSAEEIPSRRFMRLDWRRRFRTSRPAGARRWNFWAAENCRVWKR